MPRYDIYNKMQGLTIDHAISENTFYTIRISHLSNERDCRAYHGFDGIDELDERNMEDTFYLPSGIGVTEIPYGYYIEGPDVQTGAVYMGAHCAGAYDTSGSSTWDFKVDLTSQLNPYNEVKIGLEYDYSNMSTYYEKNRWESPHENWVTDWDANPIRGGAYLQDKIEFEGIIATIGLRADWNDPNIDWFDLGSYDYYFTRLAKERLGRDGILANAERSPAEGHFKISPRFGVSHPVSENAKLYFNYGEFYSLPSSYNMYQIFWGALRHGIRYLGDPELDWPRTRSYELGTDWNVRDMFKLHLAGYYKDVTNQLAAVWYTGYDEAPQYQIPENLNYEDIRGIDFRISKDFGDWVRGYLNYDYRVKTYGQTGKAEHSQDRREEATSGVWDTLDYAPRPRPLLQANIQFITPKYLGLFLGDLSLSFNYTWEAGDYITYDPLHGLGDPQRKFLNLQWKPWRNVQARIQKGLSFAGMNLRVFAEVDNLFDWKYLDASAFDGRMDDFEDYKNSLKLPLYEEEGYETYGEAGDDQFGDFKTDDKPHIDDPELTHLALHHPRYFVFGMRIDF
jgi:outer membrane receptor protein involved in Fe transport